MSESTRSSSFDDSAETEEGRIAGDETDATGAEELIRRGGRETDPATGAAVTGDAVADRDARGIDNAGLRDIDDTGLTDEDNAAGGTPKEWP